LAATSATCTVNGQLTACPPWFGAFNAGFWLFYLIVGIFMIVVMWKLFVKAGQPGWAAIIPFYNTYTLIKIAGKPGWWLLLYFIPFVNIVISIIVVVLLLSTIWPRLSAREAGSPSALSSCRSFFTRFWPSAKQPIWAASRQPRPHPKCRLKLRQSCPSNRFYKISLCT